MAENYTNLSTALKEIKFISQNQNWILCFSDCQHVLLEAGVFTVSFHSWLEGEHHVHLPVLLQLHSRELETSVDLMKN